MAQSLCVCHVQLTSFFSTSTTPRDRLAATHTPIERNLSRNSEIDKTIDQKSEAYPTNILGCTSTNLCCAWPNTATPTPIVLSSTRPSARTLHCTARRDRPSHRLLHTQPPSRPSPTSYMTVAVGVAGGWRQLRTSQRRRLPVTCPGRGLGDLGDGAAMLGRWGLVWENPKKIGENEREGKKKRKKRKRK